MRHATLLLFALSLMACGGGAAAAVGVLLTLHRRL